MSLRCSVLGHDFGESEVEREQEREGSEVVVTVREYETCNRCGETKLISENTNVTAAQDATADEDDGVSVDDAFSSDRGTPSRPDAGAEDPTAGTDNASGSTLTPPADGEDDAEILDDAADEGGAADDAEDHGDDGDADDLVDPADPAGETTDDGELVDLDDVDEDEADPDLVEPAEDDAVSPGDSGDAEVIEAEAEPEPGPDHEPAGTGDDPEDPVTDDGVILDEAADTGEREHGEWPEADANHPAEAEGDTPDSAVGWPEEDAEAEDEGYDAAPVDDAETAEVDLGGGLSPEPVADPEADDEPAEGHDAEFIGSPGRGPETDQSGGEGVDSGITRSASAQVPDGSTPVDRPTEFHCPRCDHVVPSSRSSLRAGDICPECSMGYLAERER